MRRIGQMRRQRAGVHGPSDSLSTSDRFLLSHSPLIGALSDARNRRQNLIHLPKRRRQLPRRHGRGQRLLLLPHRRRLTQHSNPPTHFSLHTFSLTNPDLLSLFQPKPAKTKKNKKATKCLRSIDLYNGSVNNSFNF